MAAELPSYSEDLFAPEALRDPFPHYQAIRDLGPVVRLARPDVYAIGRFGDVQRALRSPEVLISGQGVGFNDVVNAPMPQPSTIRSDGERHRKLRSVLAKPLMPGLLKQHRAGLTALLAAKVEGLIGVPTFDAISELARHLPLEAISHLVGLPEEDRRNMLRWASAAFNVVGPLDGEGSPAQELIADLATAQEVRAYFLNMDPSRLREGSWAEALFASVGTGRLTEGEARAAISGLVLPSLDTTIFAKGNLLHNLALHPEQWALLRERPELIPSAVLEGVRYSAVVRWFSRVATDDYAVDDVVIPAGARVMLLYGSANRDPRRYADAEQFDLTRNPTDQLGWGTGPHMCAGMNLARLEMEVMLEVLTTRVVRIEADAPTPGVNRGLYGFESLPLRLIA
jgi:cytochrome P450